jgi:hypothetical protein
MGLRSLSSGAYLDHLCAAVSGHVAFQMALHSEKCIVIKKKGPFSNVLLRFFLFCYCIFFWFASRGEPPPTAPPTGTSRMTSFDLAPSDSAAMQRDIESHYHKHTMHDNRVHDSLGMGSGASGVAYSSKDWFKP